MTDDLDPQARDILALARRAETRLPRDKEAVRRAVLQAVAVPESQATPPSTATKSTWPLKVLGALIVAAGVGALLTGRDAARDARSVSVASPGVEAPALQPTAPSTSEPVRALPPAPLPARTTEPRDATSRVRGKSRLRARRAPIEPAPVTSVPPSPKEAPNAEAQVPEDSGVVTGSTAPGRGIALELAALRRAQRALVDAQPARALRELEGVRGPGLAAERAAVEVFALCALERVAEARIRAAAFRAMAPRSPLLPRVDASCAGD